MTGIDQKAPFALLDNATSEVTYADSVSDLVDQMLDGHQEASSDRDRLLLRADALAAAAARATAAMLADLGVTGLSEDALTVLMHDRRGDAVQFSAWASDLPLLLLATSYAPYTDTPAPEGDAIVWLNPATERTFLDSLQSLGLVELFVTDPSGPA